MPTLPDSLPCASHALFTGSAAGHPSYPWVLLELRRCVETVLLTELAPRLCGDLRHSGERRLARLVEARIGMGSGETGELAASISLERTAMAQAITACAIYQLNIGLVKVVRSREIDERLGALFALESVLVELISRCGARPEGKQRRWSEFRERLELSHGRRCLQIPAMIGKARAQHESFERGVELCGAALQTCFDTLAQLGRDRAVPSVAPRSAKRSALGSSLRLVPTHRDVLPA